MRGVVIGLGLCGMLLMGCGGGELSKGLEEPPPLPMMSTLDTAQRAAIEQARMEVVAASASAAAWGRLGQVFEAAEFESEARVCYERATRLNPGEARWWHLAGLAALRDDPERGVSALMRAVTLESPTNDAPRVRLAQALVERGQFAEATKQLQMLLAGDDTHPMARLELARVSWMERREEESLTLLGPCLTNAYTARASAMLMSQIKARQGDHEGATGWATRAQSMPRPYDWPDPYVREVQSMRIRRETAAERVNGLLMQRRLAEAEAALSSIFKGAAEDPEGLLLLGRLRLMQERYEEAEAELGRHLKVRPRSVNGLVQMGMVYYARGRWEDAAVYFDRAIGLKPDFAQGHYNLGMARSRAGQTGKAVESFEAALRCNPGDADTLIILAEHQVREGEREKARLNWEEAKRLKPTHPGLERLRGRLGF